MGYTFGIVSSMRTGFLLLGLLATASTIDARPAVAQAYAYQGRILLFQGRARSAVRLLNEAVTTLRDHPTVEPSWCLAHLAEAHALLGMKEEAKTAAKEADTLRRKESPAFHVDELRALAWVDAQDNCTSSAIDQLWAAADLAASRGQHTFEIVILGDLLRLGEQGAAERSRKLTEHVDAAWSAAIAAHAAAVLSADAVDLETAADAFRSIGSCPVAAELWAAASVARQRDGMPARATEAARHSAEMAERCEGARTQPLESVVTRFPLSRRERETVKLAASGASSAQIAAVLSISVRTVESHLYAAFAKLGVTDRNQLADVLRE